MAYTTGTGCQVYRINLDHNTAEQFSKTDRRCGGTDVLKLTPDGTVSTYTSRDGSTSLR